MNQKRLFFMAGLQRSGATLLSSILNQNPNMWVSPASPLLKIMTGMTMTYDAPENIDYNRTEAIANIIKAAPHAYYADKSAKYIIDKNLNWPSPIGISLMNTYITNDIKLICPVRNVLDVLASFDTIIGSTPNKDAVQMDKIVLQETIADKPIADRRAEWQMRHDQDIVPCLNNMKYAMQPQFRKLFHFVEYDDLVNSPKLELEKIYDFLNIEKYNHVFENIEDPTGISEKSVTGIHNLHKVRPKIEKKSRNPKDVFQPDTIQRYSNMEFWRRL